MQVVFWIHRDADRRDGTTTPTRDGDCTGSPSPQPSWCSCATASLREIGRLLDDGLNLAGIAAVLALRAANRSLQAELDLTRRRASTARHPRTVR